MTTKKTESDVFRRIESFLNMYVTFSDAQYTFVLALWAAATYIWPQCDAFPYLLITSNTKRSGKTRLSEILSFVCSNPKNIGGVTPGTIFRLIRDEMPVLIIDEAEALSSESADMIRQVLNIGYRRGQTIPRVGADGGVEEWPAFCPKVFVLIGDTFDTLRDRSIVVVMQRGKAPARFLYEPAKMVGNELGTEVSTLVSDYASQIMDAYAAHAGLPFLTDRDEEIWMILFAVCQVLAPSRMNELIRAAVDIATLKTMDKRRHTDLDMKVAEENAMQDEYAEALLRDLQTVIGTRSAIFTVDALKALRELPTGPWRKFRGDGLNAVEMGALLDRFGINPRSVRPGHGRASRTARGYRRVDVDKAMKDLG